MTNVQRLESSPRNGHDAAVYGAWERFVQGEDDIRGVRPEVAISWHRCRDQYHVDPLLSEAPVRSRRSHHPSNTTSSSRSWVFAPRPSCTRWPISAIVIIADANGRVLAEWGDKATLAIAAGTGLAPWYCWSESAVGTNGIGTALGTQHPVLIRQEEHWCQAFHEWTCAGRRGAGRREQGADRSPEHLDVAQ